MGAPTCSITPKAVPAVAPSVSIGAIPVATDLNSALSAINAIRQALNQLMNRIPTTNQTDNGSPSQATAPGGGPKPQAAVALPKKQSNFTVTDVSSKQIQVPITQDSNGNFSLTMTVLSGLTMTNPITGETWTYDGQGLG